MRQEQNKEFLRRQVFQQFADKTSTDAQKIVNELYTKYTVEGLGFSDDYKFWTIINYFQNIVIPHKIEVHKAGVELLRAYTVNDFDKLAIYELLAIHDLSKFSWDESYDYAFSDFTKKQFTSTFNQAWLHHKHNNPHHPEYWLDTNKEGEVKPLEMPEVYVFEMVCDWIGAGKTYGNTLEQWLPDNLSRFLLHEKSQGYLRSILSAIGIQTEIKDNKLFVL